MIIPLNRQLLLPPLFASAALGRVQSHEHLLAKDNPGPQMDLTIRSPNIVWELICYMRVSSIYVYIYVYIYIYTGLWVHVEDPILGPPSFWKMVAVQNTYPANIRVGS